jgi:hypothetical protein
MDLFNFVTQAEIDQSPIDDRESDFEQFARAARRRLGKMTAQLGSGRFPFH